VNSTLILGIYVSTPSANQHHNQAFETEDSNAAGSASNGGNAMGHVPLEEMDSDKGDNFLDSPTHTPPQSKSPSAF